MIKRTSISSAIKLGVAGGAFGAVGVLAMAPAFAQDQPAQRVEITGSSIKRIDAETALPVTVITRDEITRSGVANMEQLVSTISASSTAQATKGSDLAGLATYGLSSVSLRGLGDNRTLVLLNGRRLAVFAGTGSQVDINSIPLSAIERVEVLRDGASAVYGSDAVAGVINFILRKDFNGLEGTLDLGTPTRSGGGKVNRANLLFGAGDLGADGFNAMVGLDLERSDALFARERSFAATGNRPPFFTSGATPTGRIEGIWDPSKTAAQNARDPANGNPFGIVTSGYGNPNAPDRCAEIGMYSSGTGGVDGAFDNCAFDSAPFVGLFPKVEHVDVFGTLKWQLGPSATLYAEGMYARNRLTEAYQPSPVRADFLTTDSAFTTSDQAALLVYPNNPAYQSILVPYFQSHDLQAMIDSNLPIAVTLRTLQIGPRTEIDTNTQSRLVAGVQGSYQDWDYDVAAMLNQGRTGGRVVDGYFSLVGLARALNDPASNWNPWAPNGVQDAALTQKINATKYVGPTISGMSRLLSLDASVQGTLTQLPGGPLQAAFGSTLRQERFKIDVPTILGTGDIAGLDGATKPEDDTRKVAALFTEFNIPVIKGLDVNASARYDRYSDVGSTTNGKLSASWKPVPEVLLRAAAGTGFRAPTLPELHQPQTLGTTEQFVDPLFAADGPIQANADVGGNPALKPEKSKQFSFGVVLSPVPSVTLGADYFAIKIDQYIAAPAALGLIIAARAGKPLYGPDDVVFAPDGSVDKVRQTLRNAASAKVEGIDLNANWQDKFDFGKLGLSLSGTYMNKFDLTTLAGVQHSVGSIVQDDGTPLDVAQLGVVSRWKHTLTGTWSYEGWTTTLVQNFYNRYRDANNQEDGVAHYVGSTATYDAQVAYEGIKDLSLALGVKNLFDSDPPLFIGNGNSFQFGYDPTNYDPRGRFVYVRATYKFW